MWATFRLRHLRTMLNTVPTSPTSPAPPRTAALLTFVLVAFAANSLVTRYVVANHLLDAYLLTVVRFVAGAVALLALNFARRERPSLTRANLWPALWLGVYAVCISFGYQHIGAAAGTFVFYATVLAGLVAHDLATRTPVPRARGVGAVVSLAGVGVLTAPGAGDVTALGVLLLAVTGAAWGSTPPRAHGVRPAGGDHGQLHGPRRGAPDPRGVHGDRGAGRDGDWAAPRRRDGLAHDGVRLRRLVCVPAPDVGDDGGVGPAGDPDPHGRRRDAAAG